MPENEPGEDRFGVEAQASEWDARYSEQGGARWSGQPNGRLVAEVADLIPGAALDVGCGEGVDAIWLAQRGWAVTAIDISAIALGRARSCRAGRRRRHPLDWADDLIRGTLVLDPSVAERVFATEVGGTMWVTATTT